MSTALALNEPGTLVPFQRMDPEQRALLRQVCSGQNLNDMQFALLMDTAIRSGLDPFQKQIYGAVIKGRFTIITGIGGFRAIAGRNGLAGIDDATHTYKDPEQRIPSTSTVTVYRLMPDGSRAAFTATARFREYAKFKDGKPDGNWDTMPHVMLDKCAEALALRKGFTESLGGLYEPSELDAQMGQRMQTRARTTAAEILADEPIDTTADFDPTDKDAP